MKAALRRLGGALGLAALAAAYTSAFPGLAVWLGPGSAMVIVWVVLGVAGVVALDLLLDLFEYVFVEGDVREPDVAAIIGLVAVSAAQLSLVSGAAIGGWPVSWMWFTVAASTLATAVAGFWLWGREERADARFWAGATPPGPGLLPPDQRAVLEGLADGGPLSILGETPPEVDAEAWERAFAILVQYGWVEPGPPPRLTAQGDAALTHDRSRRYELVANAMLGVLRDM